MTESKSANSAASDSDPYPLRFHMDGTWLVVVFDFVKFTAGPDSQMMTVVKELLDAMGQASDVLFVISGEDCGTLIIDITACALSDGKRCHYFFRSQTAFTDMLEEMFSGALLRVKNLTTFAASHVLTIP